MKGLFDMLGLDSNALADAAQTFAEMRARLERIEEKLDQILKTAEEEETDNGND